ncbi:FAD-dependent oxidoreductase [Herbiconiux sp. 11R-BC]|uniref:FAD-dependent oxidoreductase n=1 Tax=Herbiconiux sp. 11R-BC TaxID=3111637 RepID=UPI003BFAFB75
MGRIVVVGGGVVGLSCASILAERGHAVTVMARDAPGGTTSAVAASLWAPTLVEQSERVRRWAYLTLAELRRVAADPAAGVREQEALTLGVAAWTPDGWMRSFAAPVRAAAPVELPEGYGAGVVSVIPLVDTARYLPWLTRRAERAGVEFVVATVTDLAEVAPAGVPVVLAAGFGSAALTADDSVQPVRGQIVRLRNPGLSRTLMVRDGPDAPLFVVPRHDDVIVGGDSQPGRTGLEPDESLAASLLRRARRLVPALEEAEVIGQGVGLRPARPAVRLERERVGATEVVHCYGHGGAGVATSWGSALAAAALVESIA